MTGNLKHFVLSLLVAAITASAVAVVYSSHESRRLTHEVYGARGMGVVLETQNEQLLLDKAAWEAELRIDAMARSTFGMKSARDEDVVVLRVGIQD